MPELLSPTLVTPSLPPVDGVTPLCVEQFATELTNHQDQGKVAYIVEGLRQGFHLGFSHNAKLAKQNKPSALMHTRVVDEYLANEVSRGRVAGPFASPPLHTSSFGVIPKKGQLLAGKWKLIVDLSFPGGSSVNYGY